MAKSENIIRFEEALKNDPEKQEAYEAAIKKIAEEKSAGSDGEVIQKAAKVIGFDLSLEELERTIAEKQEMADEELDSVSGGWCWVDYRCHTAFFHPDSLDTSDACWEDWKCLSNWA